jgi:hypothetical protein
MRDALARVAYTALSFTLAGSFAWADTVTIPASVPLRVEVDHGYRLRVGQQVLGHLTEPVYVSRSLAIPVGAQLIGTIIGTRPVPKGERTDALLNGDFTPLKQAEVEFHTLVLAGGERLPIATSVKERTTQAIHFRSKPEHASIKNEIQTQFNQQKDQLTHTITAPEKMDRLRRFLYGQLPWHPQEIWAGTDFDAELIQPLEITHPDPPIAAAATDEPLVGTLNARLVTDLSSSTATLGAPVRAISTRPLLDSKKHVLLPEGTELKGVVLQTKRARSFGRNGALRFTFRDIVPPGDTAQTVHGQVTAAEGAKNQNLAIDDEGGVKAQPDRGRFLAPLVLGLLANKSLDQDGSAAAQGAVVSNGFGVVARIVGMAVSDRNVSAGFAFYGLSKSVYKRFIARGHDVAFAKDTLLDIELSER